MKKDRIKPLVGILVIIVTGIIIFSSSTIKQSSASVTLNSYNGKNIMVAVSYKGKWGFIDKVGQWVVKPKFTAVGKFSEGLAPAKYEDKYGYIDERGEWAIDENFESAFNFSEGLALVTVNGKYGYIDKTGEMVIEMKEENGLLMKILKVHLIFQKG